MSKVKELFEAIEAKVEADKLAVRRTTLSKTDQTFLDKIVEAGTEAEIEVSAAIRKRASKTAQEFKPEATEPSYPDSSWTVANIKAWLKEREVSFPSKVKEAELLEIVDTYLAENGL